MANGSKLSSKEFAASRLPLYHGTTVRIRIGSSDHEFKVSKDLLCKESAYFRAMFKGNFPEKEQQSVTMESVEGVVSVQSFEALMQWFYMHKIHFDSKIPGDQISAVIELIRLADMCNITGMDTEMAQYIKDILVANPDPRNSRTYHIADSNTHCLTSQHIISATFLPQGHPVRRILAAASVEGYLRTGNYKFRKETHEHPAFGADLLHEVRLALNGSRQEKRYTIIRDPISGLDITLGSD
ncbi:unnamed protein product [Penicillium salamii]|uniref:BTB domain-containing protein n=1 Tax=Penicillium salamii TaxID=1612424 RepID=A0A9W4NR91_9EURO|nr:unnamed protein product [Penicillium salamii]CAG7974425.1 unnamed protein product [Penicillium salamii]CAG8186727.1 unnamed protein product [Penicillium salamii]CAG8198824.1 unnamed protein product [Penicillium salamii]CAG8204478.1 unnamed protein product [Penicillium salamii]